MGESEQWEVDWDLPLYLFEARIKHICEDAKQKGKVIPLPIVIKGGATMLNYITLLISRVKCGSCTKCCSTNPYGNPIETMNQEAKILVQKYGPNNFIQYDDVLQIKVPCGFLDSSGRCSIYEDRPLVCVLYPFQYGAGDEDGNGLLAMASDCPEAQRIVLEIYMYRWYLRKQFIRNGTKIP